MTALLTSSFLATTVFALHICLTVYPCFSFHVVGWANFVQLIAVEIFLDTEWKLNLFNFITKNKPPLQNENYYSY